MSHWGDGNQSGMSLQNTLDICPTHILRSGCLEQWECQKKRDGIQIIIGASTPQPPEATCNHCIYSTYSTVIEMHDLLVCVLKPVCVRMCVYVCVACKTMLIYIQCAMYSMPCMPWMYVFPYLSTMTRTTFTFPTLASVRRSWHSWRSIRSFSWQVAELTRRSVLQAA